MNGSKLSYYVDYNSCPRWDNNSCHGGYQEGMREPWWLWIGGGGGDEKLRESRGMRCSETRERERERERVESVVVWVREKEARRNRVFRELYYIFLITVDLMLSTKDAFDTLYCIILMLMCCIILYCIILMLMYCIILYYISTVL